MMATINVRGVPDNVYNELKELAASDERSMNAEVLQLIEQGLQQRRLAKKRREALADLDELRQHIGPTRGDSLELLREDRAR